MFTKFSLIAASALTLTAITAAGFAATAQNGVSHPINGGGFCVTAYNADQPEFASKRGNCSDDENLPPVIETPPVIADPDAIEVVNPLTVVCERHDLIPGETVLKIAWESTDADNYAVKVSGGKGIDSNLTAEKAEAEFTLPRPGIFGADTYKIKITPVKDEVQGRSTKLETNLKHSTEIFMKISCTESTLAE